MIDQPPPPSVSYEEHLALDDKARKWRQLNAKRYSEKHKQKGHAQIQKEMMPPEHLR